MLKQSAPAEADTWSVLIGDKCVVCGACVLVCPTEALWLEDEDDQQVRLGLTPSQCTHCELCFSACMMDALSFGWAEPESRIVAASDWVHCRDCGEIISTRAEMDEVRARLQDDFSAAFIEFTESYCPACKYKRAGMPKGH